MRRHVKSVGSGRRDLRVCTRRTRARSLQAPSCRKHVSDSARVPGDPETWHTAAPGSLRPASAGHGCLCGRRGREQRQCVEDLRLDILRIMLRYGRHRFFIGLGSIGMRYASLHSCSTRRGFDVLALTRAGHGCLAGGFDLLRPRGGCGADSAPTANGNRTARRPSGAMEQPGSLLQPLPERLSGCAVRK